MLNMGTIKAIDATTGEANIEAPEVAGENVLPNVPMLPMLGLEALPQVGDRVLLYNNGRTFRYLPITESLRASWLDANRRGMRSPKGDVAVICDDADRTVKLARASADKRVVHEGLQDVLSAIKDVFALMPYGGSSGPGALIPGAGGPAQAAYEILGAAIDAIASYTAEGVLVHTDKPTSGGGAA